METPQFKLIFITADPEVSSFVVARGVDRVLVDLEILGKVERQGHLDTVISRHKFEDISLLRPRLPIGKLMVRLNPIHNKTEVEIEEAIRRGADVLMLPMFRGSAEVLRFCDAVNLRARVCLLVETVGAMEALAECIQVSGVDEVHIGLNDLHLELGCRFMFEPLVSGFVEEMARTLRSAQMPFGIGGLARVGEGLLPAEMLMAEHARLGSSAAILSRTFHRKAHSVQEITDQMDFAGEIQKLREAYRTCYESDRAELNLKHLETKAIVARIGANMPGKK
jgi:hypothetical protein